VIGACVGKRIDQDAVDDAEDGARRADAEGQREDGGEREARAAAEFTRGIAKIGDDGAHVRLGRVLPLEGWRGRRYRLR
jgi:hypothetical protein